MSIFDLVRNAATDLRYPNRRGYSRVEACDVVASDLDHLLDTFSWCGWCKEGLGDRFVSRPWGTFCDQGCADEALKRDAQVGVEGPV